MAAITNNDIRRLEHRPMVFLSLAPATSEAFPTSQSYQPAPEQSAASRRTSSQGSESAKGLRFLKLGPVHYGEHRDEHKGDFHDVAVE